MQNLFFLFSAEEKSPEKPETSNDEKKKKKKKSDKLKEAKVAALLEKFKDDQKFQEFLRIHKRNSFEEWNLDSILNVGKEFEDQQSNKVAKSDGDDDGEDVDDDANDEDDEAEPDEDKLAHDKKVSDLDYLKSMMTTVKAEGDDEAAAAEPDESKKEGKEKKKKAPKNETYFEVKLSNLPYKAKAKDVKKFLKPLKPKSLRVPRQVL